MAEPVEILTKRIFKLFTNTTFYKQLGDKARDIVFKRTKAGFGVNKDTVANPVRVPLKVLTSKGYIDYRRTIKLGRFGKPGRSNLTLTGQMLDSIKVIPKRNGFEVVIPKTRRRAAGNRRRDPNTNNDILQFTRKARPFFALTTAEQRIITQEIRRALNKQLNITLSREIK
jgi:hypothetical protein